MDEDAQEAAMTPQEFYNQDAEQEWNRLTQDPYHRLEFDTTLHFLEKYLPANGTVLDAGGGPGRYTITLAKQGYNVVLLDIAEENLRLAREKIREAGVEDRVEDIVQGTITDLAQFEPDSFDAVLCLGGPLSHVKEEAKRETAAAELVRIAKPGAPIFASVLGRLGVIMDAPRQFPDEIELSDHFEQLWRNGEDTRWYGGESYAHFFRLDEFENLFPSTVDVVETVGLEGLANPSRDAINEHAENEEWWENWMRMHRELCTDRAVAALSNHILLVLEKTG